MPRARAILERFRPVGAPGAAPGAGVPADRVAELAAELGPVLALLDGTQAECAGSRGAAEAAAARIRADGAGRARAVVASELVDQRRDESRGIDTTLDRAWRALSALPRRELTMLPSALVEARYAADPGRPP